MPAKAKSGPVGAITRKIGPLPLWAWFVGVLAAYYAYGKLRGGSSSSSSAPTVDNSGNPLPDTAGAAGGVSSGGGTSADNMSGDLLSALLQSESQSQQALVDALNAAYANQYYAAGYGGYGGAAPGSISTSGPASSGATVLQPQTATAPTNQESTALTQVTYGSYSPTTGIYTTPEGVQEPPTTSYSSTPGGVTGPSIFAFKGTNPGSPSDVAQVDTTRIVPTTGTAVAV